MLSLLLLLSSAFANTYIQDCRVENTDDYLQATLTVNGDWTWRETAFEAAGCVDAYLIYDRVYAAAIDGQNLNLSLRSASYTSLNNDTTMSLNGISWCGFSDWQTGVAKDVTGRTCEDYQVPSSGQTIYSIIKSSGTQLWLGEASDGHDGSSDAQRFVNWIAQPFNQK
jgi:hypothetical protein